MLNWSSADQFGDEAIGVRWALGDRSLVFGRVLSLDLDEFNLATSFQLHQQGQEISVHGVDLCLRQILELRQLIAKLFGQTWRNALEKEFGNFVIAAPQAAHQLQRGFFIEFPEYDWNSSGRQHVGKPLNREH